MPSSHGPTIQLLEPARSKCSPAPAPAACPPSPALSGKSRSSAAAQAFGNAAARRGRARRCARRSACQTSRRRRGTGREKALEGCGCELVSSSSLSTGGDAVVVGRGRQTCTSSVPMTRLVPWARSTQVCSPHFQPRRSLVRTKLGKEPPAYGWTPSQSRTKHDKPWDSQREPTVIAVKFPESWIGQSARGRHKAQLRQQSFPNTISAPVLERPSRRSHEAHARSLRALARPRLAPSHQQTR